MATRSKTVPLYCPPDPRMTLKKIKLYYAARRVLGLDLKDSRRGGLVTILRAIPTKKKKK